MVRYRFATRHVNLSDITYRPLHLPPFNMASKRHAKKTFSQKSCSCSCSANSCVVSFCRRRCGRRHCSHHTIRRSFDTARVLHLYTVTALSSELNTQIDTKDPKIVLHDDATQQEEKHHRRRHHCCRSIPARLCVDSELHPPDG